MIKKMSSLVVTTSLLASLFVFPVYAVEANKETQFNSELSFLLEKNYTENLKDLDRKITYQELLNIMKLAEEKGLIKEDKELAKEMSELTHSQKTDAFVTRQDLATIVSKTLLKKKPEVSHNVLNYFTDASSISKEARPYVAYAVLEGVFAPTLDGKFDPEAPATLVEVSAAMKLVKYDVIDILSTNDIHGTIEVGFDKNRNTEQGGMETVGGIVQDYRAANPKGTVMVDGGDAWQGTLISNTVNGQSVIDTMDDIKYDAAAIGNHEFDFTLPVLIDNIKKAKTPILGANIMDEKTEKRVEWTKPYVIVKKGDYKIGIIGLATPQTVSTTKSSNIKGLKFVDPVPVTKEHSKELRKQGCDIVIVTSHLPGEQEKESQKIMGEMVELANGTGTKLLDAIVGGHSHKRVAGKVNGIPVVEAQSHVKAVGHIQLFVDKKTKKVVDSNVNMLETYASLTKADSSVHDIVAKYKEKIGDYANRVEAVAGEKLSALSYRYAINGNVARDGVSPLGALITDAMRASEKSDIAFTNIGGVRADIDKGDMTYSKMFSVLPFGNYNVTGTMTAEQIKGIFEATDKYSKLPAIQFSGLKVEWDATKEPGNRYSKITLVDGTPVYVDGKFATRTFTVTTNDFLATGAGDEFKVFGEVKDWKDGAIMLDAWVKYVNAFRDEKKEIFAPNDGRDVRLDLK